ncbi:hypothetical protein PHSY_003980 [Pseudozyma hubeiensis SY62]|uniref:Zn(2)-C6 fungal-type domain-containing protein n=1 Tax=Pseudozyma hubeiensis (strain SY62) TaxID=1305764 RepID=R9PE96_PSEHS|nr:hypothetical protein PHSY_003980 [Pseudozyma hubeiensis SY62]GAC96400.1 hypothetical protein PHSY_003980 [Pseudozyma hubeiensis SY62]
MNSLADAAAQASAAAAAAASATASSSEQTVAAPSLLTTSATASTDTPSRPERSSNLPDRPLSSSYPADDRPNTSNRAHAHIDASASPVSSPDSASDMNRNCADTPVRRALLDTEKPEKRGSNLACLKCRAIKVKCSRANADDERCKRCNRLDLVCEFKEHHRGRKPKKRPRSEADSTGADEEDQLEDDEAEASFSFKADATSPVHGKPAELSRSPLPSNSASSLQHHHHHHHASSSYKKPESGRFDAKEPPPKLPSPKGSIHGRWFGPYLQPIPSFEDSLFPRKQHSHSASQHHSQQYRGPSSKGQQQHQHNHSYHHDRSRELPPLSIPSSLSSNRNGVSPNDSGAWDRTSAWTATKNSSSSTHRMQQSTSAPTAIANDVREDVVCQHIITKEQAHELFDYFFAELNPPLALLDTSLHTMDYCRQNTPILFSAIISVASRFFSPQYHRQCHRVAKSILNLAAAEEICTIDHIQALILVITWKDPGDRTILRKAVRAIGYAYELGLHAAFGNIDAVEPLASSSRTSDANRDRSDSYSQRYRKRRERDRQRTWIVLCLIHELVRRDDRNPKPRARVIPVEDYPDPYAWIKQGGDVLLSVDSRLGWSLGMSILVSENEPFLEIINRSEDATSFAGFFERLRGRLDILRQQYFDVREGVYHPRFPMDKSAVVELPYLDAFRDYYICQSTWHWAAKVASQRRTRRSELAEQQDSARSAFWFSQTVDSAMRCLRIFAQDLCKDGHVRVGHDYLVITASEITKWFYLYREHLDASTLTAGVEHLRAALRECSQPQRLATGEVVDTEREAPGYFVRFLEAIFDAGLNESVETAKKKLAANVERFRDKKRSWERAAREHTVEEQSEARREGRDGHDGSASANSRNTQSNSNTTGGTGSRRLPWAGAHSSYQQQQQPQPQPSGGSAALSDRPNAYAMPAGNSPTFRDTASAAARYSAAPSLPRGRSEVGLDRSSAPSVSSGSTSFERGGTVEKMPPSPSMFNGLAEVNSMSTGAGSLNSTNPIAPHPAYLASAGSAAGNTGQALQTGFGSRPWSSLTPITPSWSNNGGAGSASMLPANNNNNNNPVGGLPAASNPDYNLTFGGAEMMTPSAVEESMGTTAGASVGGANVVPLAGDMGKNSIEGLAACLNARDLTYWQDILGFDLPGTAE